MDGDPKQRCRTKRQDHKEGDSAGVITRDRDIAFAHETVTCDAPIDPSDLSRFRRSHTQPPVDSTSRREHCLLSQEGADSARTMCSTWRWPDRLLCTTNSTSSFCDCDSLTIPYGSPGRQRGIAIYNARTTG